MSIEKADVVRSLRGRDSGELFMVLSVEGQYAYIINGKDRRLEKAKKKKLKHIEFICAGEGRTAQKLRDGERVSNSEIRKALNVKPSGEAEGGMHSGEG